MGTGGSFLRNPDDDDMGADFDGASRGVIKRIPIEMKPRGKLMGLRSVGSLGKKQPKGGSLQSALSVDIENPEVERIKRDFEMYRLNKENEIANVQKKDMKLETENKRLRGELLALQKTCSKLRAERDAAVETEQQAFARAAAFESDRDKVQRQFKIFRETKESEIQNLLRSKRQIEHRLTKISQGFVPDDSETISRVGLDSTIGNHGDWWTTLDSEASLGSTLQLHQPYFRGPEFAHTMVELEGPFTNVNKDDWNVAVCKLTQIVPTIPEHVSSHMIRLYLSAPRDMHHEVDIMTKEYIPKLEVMCTKAGRILVTVYLPLDDYDNIDEMKNLVLESRRRQVQLSNIFLAFLGEHTNRLTGCEFSTGYLDNPSSKPAVFCFRDPAYKGCKPSQGEARELKVKVGECSGAKVIDGYTSPSNGADSAYTELSSVLDIELGIEAHKKTCDDHNYTEEGGCTQQLTGVHLWDPLQDTGQLEAFSHSLVSSCQLAFEKYYDRLNQHISSAGPLPPLLVLGQPGSGKSLLLAKWLQMQQDKGSGCLVLYHFVGRRSSTSADPLVMIRRLTAQLMQHISSPPEITTDATRLIEEFPQWLEKVSSKSPGGAILVLDSIDRFTNAEVHLSWLLDPLPVDLRVVVSVSDDSCPQTWQSWPSLRIESLSNKNVKHLLHAELSALDRDLSSEDETKILTHCRTDATCNSLYVMVLSRSLSLEGKGDGNDDERCYLDNVLNTTDSVSLYKAVLGNIRQTYETPQTHGVIKHILRYLVQSRDGLTEPELLDLVSGLSWNFWTLVSHALIHQLVLSYRCGLITFTHDEAERAVREKYLCDRSDMETQLRQECIDYFSAFLHPTEVTFRVVDELLPLLQQADQTESLHNCLLNLSIFQQLYSRGRHEELLGHWEHVGVDQHTMAQLYFTAIKRLEENIDEMEGTVTLPRIADLYEMLGKFLKDMGHLSEALPSMQRALEVRETALDPDHPSVAQSLHQLAGLHTQWGKFSTAEALYKQSLEIYENALGGEHRCVAGELDALALLYQKQDKHDLAEPLRRRAVLIRKKNKATDMTLTQSRLEEPMRRQALQLEELTLAPASPDLARTLNELGVLYYLQNNFSLAESFFTRSLDMRETTLGTDHPDLAQSLNNLAALYNDNKQYDRAEPLYERALQIRTKNFSPDHSSVATIVKHLATLYKKQGKWGKAESMYRRVVEVREKSFGHKHPAVATALVNLAVLYSQRTKYSEAEPLYAQAIRIYEESFGENHPRVAETLRNVAVMKYEQGDYETAARYYKRATEMKETEDKTIHRRSSSTGSNTTLKNILRS